MLLWFIAGIIVGWIVELIIDWRFWRRTAYTPEPASITTINELATLRRKVKEYEVRIQSLEAKLENASKSQPKSAKPGSATE